MKLSKFMEWHSWYNENLEKDDGNSTVMSLLHSTVYKVLCQLC